VLITPEQFNKRFLDWQAKKDRERFLDTLKALKKNKKGTLNSVEVLRRLRGYDK
jgi:hypothetical protein